MLPGGALYQESAEDPETPAGMSEAVTKVREKRTGVGEKPADTMEHDRSPKPEAQNRVSHDCVRMEDFDRGVGSEKLVVSRQAFRRSEDLTHHPCLRLLPSQVVNRIGPERDSYRSPHTGLSTGDETNRMSKF